MATTTFKVVEFYRNNNNNNSSSSILLNASSDSNAAANNISNLTNNSSFTLSSSDTATRNGVVKSPTVNGAIESSTSSSCPPPGDDTATLSSAISSTKTTSSTNNSSISSSNLLYNSLGFNVLGGYLTNMPATIVDISSSLNSKLVKVEEGDIILEINGLSTRHLSLSEIYKQLRCCGNRVLLRLKSDPEYKSRFRDIVNQNSADSSSRPPDLHNAKSPSTFINSSSPQPAAAYSFHLNGYNKSPTSINGFNGELAVKTTTNASATHASSFGGGYLQRNASKSYDNHINTYGGSGSSGVGNYPHYPYFMTHSSTSSNVSSAANSHSNILDTSPSANEAFNSPSTTNGPLKLGLAKSLPTATSTSLTVLSVAAGGGNHQPISTASDLSENSQRTADTTVTLVAGATSSSSSTSSPSSASSSSSSAQSSSSQSATQMPSNDYSWSTASHHQQQQQVESNNNISNSKSSNNSAVAKVNVNEQMNLNFQNEIELENDKIVLSNKYIDDLVTSNNSNQSSSPPPTTTTNNNNILATTANSQQAGQPSQPAPVMSFQVEIDDSIKRKIDEKLKECSSGDSDSDSEANVYTPKAVDLPSAQRLAKRLYYLDGFRANDVVRHLCKKNDFSQLVADEYLKLFNFQSLTLDAALRKFLKQFQLVGDPHEKERVLMYFAKSYVDANNTAFNDVDSCHTLTCALMLLNTDLHDSKVQNKMKLNEFIENLKGLNNGGNFPDVLLESLYTAIKNEPLECACLDGDDLYDDRNGNVNSNGNFSLRPNGSNPFIQIPDPQTAKEYKFGWLLRKCCIDSDGKKAPFLKRSWKMFYASLRDMVLYLHKDDKSFKNSAYDNISNAIRIHHAYASIAADYKKKQFVFRLKTADWAEYLFQTSNSTELYDWVSTINLVAAMFSSPPLPGAIGSNKTFQRPLLPVSKTRYTLQEQFEYHKKHLKQIQCDLVKLEMAAGASSQNNHTLHHNSSSLGGKDEKHFDKDKYNYLQFEIQRYKTYVGLLEEKILSESAIMNNATTVMPGPMNMINPTFVLNDSSAAATTNNTATVLLNHQFHHLIPMTNAATCNANANANTNHAYTNHLNHMNALHNSHHHLINTPGNVINAVNLPSNIHNNQQFLSYPPSSNDFAAASKSMPSTPTHHAHAHAMMMNGGGGGVMRNSSNQSVLVNYGAMNGGGGVVVNQQLTPTSPTLTAPGGHKKLNNNYLD